MPTVNILAGTVCAPQFVAPGALVSVSPAAGGSALVEYTTADAASIVNGVATWAAWAMGAVTAAAADLCNKAAYVRVTALGGAASLTVDSVPLAGSLAFLQQDWGAVNLSSVQQNAKPGVFNASPANLTRWRKALAGVRAGTGRAKLALIGDSTTAGTGSSGGGTNNAVAASYPSFVASILSSFYIAATAASSWGRNMLPATDPRVAAPNWVQSSYVLNGNSMRANGITDTMTFTPGVSWDTAEVWYADLAGSGTFTVNADGGAALATVTPSGTGAIKKVTITKALGTSVLGVARTSGGSVYIAGMVTYDSTSKKVDVLNLGWHGSKVADWATANASYINNVTPASNITQVAPDLSVICLTINDWGNTTDLVTYKTNLQTIVSAALTTGDVVLVSGVPSSTSSASVAQQARYIDVMKQVAVANNTPFINLTQRFVSYDTTNALGLYSDTLHPTGAGYADVAQAITNVIGAP
jgi:lysophospholipase L1-like esterase